MNPPKAHIHGNALLCDNTRSLQADCCAVACHGTSAQDTDDMDYNLPQSISEFGNCIFQLLATIIFICVVQYWFILGIVPLLCLYYMFQHYYRCGCRVYVLAVIGRQSWSLVESMLTVQWHNPTNAHTSPPQQVIHRDAAPGRGVAQPPVRPLFRDAGGGGDHPRVWSGAAVCGQQPGQG